MTPVESAQLIELLDAEQLPTKREELRLTDSPFNDLRGWQKRVMTGRLIIVSEVNAYARNMKSINRAIEFFLEMVKNRALAPGLLQAVKDANCRKGKKRVLSKGNLYKWLKGYKDFGHVGLAPKAVQKRAGIEPWAQEFVTFYRQPQKPSIPQVREWMVEARKQEGRSLVDMPSYGQLNRFLKKYSFLDQNRGRMTGSELRAIRVYNIRDFSELEPFDIVCGDGHSWKSKVANPYSGKPFNPEVEGVIDVATRMLVGWSAGLAESAQVVADALRYVVTINEHKPYGGIPAIYYSDHGAGNKAKRIEGPMTGLLARLGTTAMHSIPGVPQSRGVIERMQASVWIRAAKEHASFSGKTMDSLALRRVTKIIDADIKAGRISAHLMSWAQFMEFLAFHAQAYNNRPHSSLPKITDPQTGLRRHMTPMERWMQFVEQGWTPVLPDPAEFEDLFRPQEIVTTKNGMFKLLGNSYFNVLLEHYHGQRIIAEYEVQQAEHVRVRDIEGRLICVAAFEGNKSRWIPKTLQDITKERRAQGREKRLQIRMDEVKAEARGTIDLNEAIPDYACNITPPALPLPQGGTTDAGFPLTDCGNDGKSLCGNDGKSLCGNDGFEDNRPFFGDNLSERYEWHQTHGFTTEEDMEFRKEFEQSYTYRMLYAE